MRLKVSSTNFYVGNRQPIRDAEFLRSLHCDLSGVQEGHAGNAQDINRALHRTHKVFWGHSKNRDTALAMLDVPVVIDKELEILNTSAKKISNRAQRENIGMPRAATVARVRKGKRTITFINTHLNAAVQNRNNQRPLGSNIKRVREYVKSIKALEVMIKRAQHQGDLVILVGDLNFTEQRHGIWRYSPEALFKRCKMEFRSEHLDYIGYSRELHAGRLNIIPTSRTGSDHPWATLELSTEKI